MSISEALLEKNLYYISRRLMLIARENIYD